MSHDFRKLRVWRASLDLAQNVHELSRPWPRDEWYVRQQLRRAAGSIGANLAGGAARSPRDFARFVRIALGSANELEHWLRFAAGIGLVAKDALPMADLRLLQGMLEGLHDRLLGLK